MTNEELFKHKLDALSAAIVNKANVDGKKDLDALLSIVNSIVQVPEVYEVTSLSALPSKVSEGSIAIVLEVKQ